MSTQPWFLYALRCADGTIYTGVTTHLARRLAQHNAGRGARYTAGRRPVTLAAAWRCPDRSTAQQAEARFRRLDRRRKVDLIAREAPFEGAPFYRVEQAHDNAPLADRFCPRCGGALETIRGADDERPRQACSACGRVHYRNAKPCAGTLIVRDGRLLLLRRTIEPFRGYWDIPGGFLEEDEHPEQAAMREAREETGLEIRLTKLFGFYVDRYGDSDEVGYCLNIYYLAEVVSGTERTDAESDAIEWFAPDELPAEIAFEHAQEVLADWARQQTAT